MKRLFYTVLLIFPLLCSCSNNEPDETKIIQESKNVIESTEIEDDSSGTEGISMGVVMHKVRRDEATGEIQFGSMLGKEIEYLGEELELGLTMNITVPAEGDKNITLLSMLVVDNKLISFSYEGEEKSVLHKIDIKNGMDIQKVISFKPDNLKKCKISNVVFIGIPLIENLVNPQDDILVMNVSNKIISNIDSKGNLDDSNSICKAGYFFDSVKNVYGKELYEISKYNGVIRDYILQDEKGDWYYMGDYSEGQYVTVLFCDDMLYKGFNGSDRLMVEKNTEGQVHMKIDMSSLTEGSHGFYAVTFNINNEFGFIECFKSQKVEVIK